EILRSIRAAAERRSLALEVRYAPSLPGFLRLDPLRLRQIISNLLSNAIKFSDHGAVTLTLSWQAQQLTAAVTDQGTGISPDMLSELCRPFVRGDSTARRSRGGVGLGLYIVKNLTEALGGTLGVQSRPGEGSTFTVTVPTTRAARPPTAAPRPPPDLLPLVVLLVDDNDLNRRILSRLLERWGCTVIEAASGEAALAAAAQPHDAILMDIWMPDMDGITAARLIRDRGLSTGPIFAMTADTRATAGTDDVFDQCLQKPFAHTDLQQLLATVPR
ncbi:MAG: CheY-like chemotaxis protein/anti-sigma regulatory factor (Ser/Thr protein kinase), partial [Myxococcota bacterium]